MLQTGAAHRRGGGRDGHRTCCSRTALRVAAFPAHTGAGSLSAPVPAAAGSRTGGCEPSTSGRGTDPGERSLHPGWPLLLREIMALMHLHVSLNCKDISSCIIRGRMPFASRAPRTAAALLAAMCLVTQIGGPLDTRSLHTARPGSASGAGRWPRLQAVSSDSAS